jgi:hypothetical protein
MELMPTSARTKDLAVFLATFLAFKPVLLKEEESLLDFDFPLDKGGSMKRKRSNLEVTYRFFKASTSSRSDGVNPGDRAIESTNLSPEADPLLMAFTTPSTFLLLKGTQTIAPTLISPHRSSLTE